MGYSSICYAHYTPLAYPLPNPLAMGYIPISVHVYNQETNWQQFGSSV